MADRRLRYPLLWLGFVVSMFIGAGLVLSDDGWKQALGLVLLLAPLVVLLILSLAYYFVERYRAMPR